MTNLKRVRLICGLRQIDVTIGTGIPMQRISQAERGRVDVLTAPEKSLLLSFLQEQFERIQDEAPTFNLCQFLSSF